MYIHIYEGSCPITSRCAASQNVAMGRPIAMCRPHHFHLCCNGCSIALRGPNRYGIRNELSLSELHNCTLNSFSWCTVLIEQRNAMRRTMLADRWRVSGDRILLPCCTLTTAGMLNINPSLFVWYDGIYSYAA